MQDQPATIRLNHCTMSHDFPTAELVASPVKGYLVHPTATLTLARDVLDGGAKKPRRERYQVPIVVSTQTWEALTPDAKGLFDGRDPAAYMPGAKAEKATKAKPKAAEEKPA